MKNVTITLIGIFFFISSSALAKEPQKTQPQIQQNIRYQVISVDYEAMSVKGSFIRKAVLKIDVLTGETWILSDVMYKDENNKTIVSRGWQNLEVYGKTESPQ